MCINWNFHTAAVIRCSRFGGECSTLASFLDYIICVSNCKAYEEKSAAKLVASCMYGWGYTAGGHALPCQLASILCSFTIVS